MSNGQVIFYDFAHVSEFLATNAEQIAAANPGLGALAPYRPLYYAFTQEALDTNAITLGQFDAGLVYMFVPEDRIRSKSPEAHKVARAKAVELIDGTHPPMIFEIKAAQTMEPPIAPQAACESWMTPELLETINSGTLQIHLMINGHAFFSDILMPTLEQNEFTTPDDYLSGAKSGFIRVRHPAAPGKGYKLPWIKWLREMLTGGYSMAYPMACLGTYLQKVQQTINAPSGKS